MCELGEGVVIKVVELDTKASVTGVGKVLGPTGPGLIIIGLVCLRLHS